MKRISILASLLLFPILVNANQLQSISTPLPTSTFDGNVSYFGYVSAEVKDVQSKNPGLYSYHLLAFNYNHSPRYTWSLRPTFTYESEGTRWGDKLPARLRMADSNITLIDQKPLSLPDTWGSKLNYKLFLPTDPEWQKAGTVAGFGINFEIYKDLPNAFSIGYYPKGFVLLNIQERYLTDYDGYDVIKPTQLAQIEQWIRLTKYFGDRLSLSQGVGYKTYVFNASTNQQRAQTNHALLESTINLSVNNNVDISVGIAQEHISHERSWQPYHDEESTYIFMTSIRI